MSEAIRQQIVTAPHEGRHFVFLEGPAGAGKTTLAVQRLVHFLEAGVPGDAILLLLPQRTLAQPYQQALASPTLPAGSEVTLVTLAGLAQRTITLFWPLVAADAGFGHPELLPVFLNLETAQYHMHKTLEPLLEQRYFDALALRPHRLATEVLGSLNKAAAAGFPYTELATRLKAAWTGESSRLSLYDQLQEAAGLFRQRCLRESLLDFSLQMEVFRRHILPLPEAQRLLARYTHVIADNVEENTPVAHDFLLQQLPYCQSALFIFDQEGGYRALLGADPISALRLKPMCTEQITLPESLVPSAELQALGATLSPTLVAATERGKGDALEAVTTGSRRFHSEMLDWVADEISRLISSYHVPAGEIVVLAPHLSDALRFALADRLSRFGIPTVSHRPSRALEEPGTRPLLTLAALAHPQWKIAPPTFDVAQMLMQSIEGLDWVRAEQLARIVYRVVESEPRLSTFRQINADVQERVTYLLGGRYDDLVSWLEAYRQGEPAALDQFWTQLLCELLSQPGYGYHHQLDAMRAANNLIESARTFRETIRAPEEGFSIGQEYVRMIERGVVAAQHLADWQEERRDAVLIAPAYVYLLHNRPVDYQFWIEIGSLRWWERLSQPLTHPYVLSRQWPLGRPWTDADEFQARQAAMEGLLLGLIRRCRKRLYWGISELGETGFEQRGPLLERVQRLLRRAGEGLEVLHG